MSAQKKTGSRSIRGNGPIDQGGAGIDETFDTTEKGKARIIVKNGTVCWAKVPYAFGNLGKVKVAEYLDHRCPAGSGSRPNINAGGDKTDKDVLKKFELSGYKPHPHPVGAFARSFFGDLVYYLYGADYDMLDIGASRTRLSTSFDSDGSSLMNRVYSMTPTLSGRDEIRDIDMDFNHQEMFNNCCCVAGQFDKRCENCHDVKQPWKLTTSQDAVYYPGVYEEHVYQAYKSKGVAFYAMNDFSRIYGDKIYKALDGESEVRFEGNEVIHKVNGNLAPYRHRFMDTGKSESWQYAMHVGDDLVWAINQRVEEFWNGDIPYVLVKMWVISDETLRKHGENEGINGVPYIENRWFVGTSKTNIIDVGEMEFDKIDIENHHKYLIDYKNKDKYFESQSDMLRVAMNFYNDYIYKNNEKFWFEKVDGKEYMHLQVVKNGWWRFSFLKVERDNLHYSAPSELVFKCYQKLGSKNLDTSMMNVLASLQKELEAEIDKSDVVNLVDAMAIAKVMKAQQNLRMQSLIKEARSLQH